MLIYPSTARFLKESVDKIIRFKSLFKSSKKNTVHSNNHELMIKFLWFYLLLPLSAGFQ